MSKPERCIIFIEKHRRERELQNRVEVLKDQILQYAIDENWDVVRLFVKDLQKTQDEPSYIN